MQRPRRPRIYKATALRLFAFALICSTTPAHTAVADFSPQGFTIKIDVKVATTPEKLYDTMINQVGSWWNPEHTYSGDAKNLSIDARAGGCFCEDLGGGAGVEHLRVVYVQPGQTLRMSGALGPMQRMGLAGSMTWSIQPVGSTTALSLTYSVGGYMKGGFAGFAPKVDAMLSEQVNRLKKFAETTTP